jgi:hypothetical protein
VKSALRHAGRAAAGMLPAALLVRLGMPALAALVFLAVLVLGVICWIIGSPDRSDRVTRMMLARRGDATCLEPGTSTLSSPTSRSRRSVRSGGNTTPGIGRVSRS